MKWNSLLLSQSPSLPSDIFYLFFVLCLFPHFSWRSDCSKVLVLIQRSYQLGLLLRDSSMEKAEILAVLKSIENSFTAFHQNFRQCLIDIDSRIAVLTNTTSIPPLSLQLREPTTFPSSPLHPSTSHPSIPALLSPLLPDHHHISLFHQKPSPPPQLTTPTEPTFEQLLKKFEIARCVSAVSSADIGGIALTESVPPTEFLSGTESLLVSEELGSVVCSSLFHTVPSPPLLLQKNNHHHLPVANSECLISKSMHIDACRDKSEGYASTLALALLRYLQINCIEPIPLVIYSRALIPWYEEPPDSLFRGFASSCFKVANLELGFVTLNLSSLQICCGLRVQRSEWRLCEQIFKDLGISVDDACFVETIDCPAIQLFNFTKAISISMRLPEKLSKILDLHDALSDYLPNIESEFETKSSESIKVQAVEILSKLAEAVRGVLSEFENAVLCEPSRVRVLGGTSSVMQGVSLYPFISINHDNDLGLSLLKLDLGPPKKFLILCFGNPLVKRVHLTDKAIVRDLHPDTVYGKFLVFKRPFCNDFLKFCFERFEVALWSSAREHNIEGVWINITGGSVYRSKLLFVWSQEEHAYCSAPIYTATAPPRCLQIGHTGPILRVSYGRAVIIWDKEPRGTLSLDLTTPLKSCLAALFHTICYISACVSVSQVALSFTHVIKSVEPMFTGSFSSFIGDSYPLKVWLSILLNVFGCSLAAVINVSFNLGGLWGAMISNVGFVRRNIYSRKSLQSFKELDERAVLKYFDWSEEKVDALREAAFSYCDLKAFESEISFFRDELRKHCSHALKIIQNLFEKLEHVVYNVLRMRESGMGKYKGFHISGNWMLDTCYVSLLKLASVKLAVKYMKRIAAELEMVGARPEEEELTVQATSIADLVPSFSPIASAFYLFGFRRLIVVQTIDCNGLTDNSLNGFANVTHLLHKQQGNHHLEDTVIFEASGNDTPPSLLSSVDGNQQQPNFPAQSEAPIQSKDLSNIGPKPSKHRSNHD